MIILLLLFITTIIILLLLYNKKKKELERTYEEKFLTNNKEILENKLNIIKKQYEEKYQWYNDTMQVYDTTIANRKNDINDIISEFEQRAAAEKHHYAEQMRLIREQNNQEIEHHKQTQQAAADAELQTYQQSLDVQKQQITHDFDLFLQEREQIKQQILNEINEYQKKQQSINDEIMRRREMEEKQDFYRISLSNQDKTDIHYLLSITSNLRNPSILHKLIWSEYLQKPFQALLKNLFNGREVRCVIYKITNISTNEIYIGKTKAEVAKRWTEHIKTSLGIGTVSKSKIHEALFNNWDSFTFEVLEEVKDETQLSAREKFYINFYQSNIYGYNLTSGG